jgi:hypothetical protein
MEGKMYSSYDVVLVVDSYHDDLDYKIKFEVGNVKNVSDVFEFVKVTTDNLEKNFGKVVHINIEFDYSVEE